MALVSKITGDQYVAGNLSCQTLTVPAGTLTNAGVNASADINASKLEHQHQICVSQKSTASASDERWPAHVVYGTSGTLLHFEAGSITAAAGNDTCAVDLLKNGTSVLSAAISLTSSHTARQLVSATISTTTLSDGDVLEVDINATHGTGTLAAGVFANLVLTEKAS
ncbi:MAG: hypothetical protein PHU85_13715 [Phycisphaerae bacterium]|nr:hypothetical protein [Phycisphaerae bacterium]